MEKEKLLYKKTPDNRTIDVLKKVVLSPAQVFYMNDIDKEAINEAFWKRFYGVKSLEGPIPDYLGTVMGFTLSMRCAFVLLSYVLFSDYALNLFSESSISMLKGVCKLRAKNKNKQDDLLYYLLKYSGANVLSGCDINGYYNFDFDYNSALRTPAFGKSIKALLQERIFYAYPEIEKELDDDTFYKICSDLRFDKALGLDQKTYRQWLDGELFGEYIDKVRIQNFVCINDVSFEFGKAKEVYLLGENGDGKTLLLDALYLTFAGHRLDSLSSEKAGEAKDMLNKVKNQMAFLSGSDNLMAVYGSDCTSDMNNIYAYGTHRGRIASKDDKKAEKHGFMTLFDADRTLINPSEWIKNVCYREVMTSLNSSISNKVAMSVSPHVMVEDKLKALQKIFDILLDKKVDVQFDKDYEVIYVENDAKLKFSELSEGYRTTLIFVCDLLYRLCGNKLKCDSGEAMDSKAVVLIDEIDAHLHPRWQRTIVGRMRKIFPNIQFIMTTHSPHIIQGASQDAMIYRVYRDKGKTCVSEPYLRSDLNYMMINTLATSPLFGLEDARLKIDDKTESTSSTYLMDRIEKFVLKKIQSSNLKDFFTEAVVDSLIESAWEAEKKQ